MTREHLTLVARRPNGSYAQHPVESIEDVRRVYGWLHRYLEDAIWSIQEGE